MIKENQTLLNRLNVISDGEYIEKDTPVCITRVDGNRILVHPQA